MARVLLTRQAKSHFDELPPNLQDPVLNALTDIEANPPAAGKQLLGRLKGLWSARVGNYRILYTIEGSSRSPRVIAGHSAPRSGLRAEAASLDPHGTRCLRGREGSVIDDPEHGTFIGSGVAERRS